ncbi:MAG: AAA family ATPase, partial [archaeon]|nr:AAA family ATPase [archaeon]
MVHINKLILHGFKSFQKKTVIPLNSGFNAVIGPNGSGKSNVMDALTFVFGRRSKALRAGRMDHLIFNGGQGKKPSDFALVALELDNLKREMPIDEDTVSVSRKVNRSGISVYKLNNRLVNKREIDEMLHKINIDPDGHNIIQQGDITRVVQMKPKERREIIDEIAGIKDYNEKRDKSLTELANAEITLNESKIVLDQKKEYTEKLKLEKEAAEKFLELEKKQDFIMACIAHSKVEGIKTIFENVKSNLKTKESEYKASNTNVGSFDTDLDKLESELEKVDKDIFRKSMDTEGRTEIEEINEKIIKRAAKVESYEKDMARLEDMISRLETMNAGKTEGISNRAVKSLIDSGINGVYGIVGNLMETEVTYRVAVEIAAGGHVNDVIVDKEKTALECINYLKENHLGRVRFLPLDRMHLRQHSAKSQIASKMAGILDYVINLVDFDPKYNLAFTEVFKDTLVAETTDSAGNVRGLKIVTLDGELFEAGGAIVGGVRKSTGNVRKQDTAVSDIMQYRKEKETSETEIRMLKEEIGDLNNLLAEKRENVKEDSEEIKSLDAKRENLKGKISKIKENRKTVYEQNIMLQRDIEDLRIRKARLEAELENLLIPYEKYKDRTDLKKDDPEKLQSELKKIDSHMRTLGPVNQKAIEEYNVFSKDFDDFNKRVEC